MDDKTTRQKSVALMVTTPICSVSAQPPIGHCSLVTLKPEKGKKKKSIQGIMASTGNGKQSLLLLRRVDATFSAALHARFRVLDLHASSEGLHAFLASAATGDSPRAALVGASGAVVVDGAFLDSVPSLRCVVTTSAGVNHIDLAECGRRSVAVAGAGNIFSVDVADHAVGLLLDVLRRVSAADGYVRRGLWPAQGDFLPLASKVGGKRVGIIGLGSIGSLIAKRLQAMGCVISYHSRTPKSSVAYRYFADVHALAADSDALVVACALNGATRHIVSKGVLDALGPKGVVVNIARGGNVDERALVAALKEGRIAGAGLDVFENEPHVPPELMAMDNVVLTAHEAVFTEESIADLQDIMIANLEAFFAGKPLLTPVLPQLPS